MQQQTADDSRPSWDSVYISMAMLLATRATCPRLRTAAIIVNQHQRIIASGYNGAPHKRPHCLDVGCLIEDGHCLRAVHAESNAITSAAREGIAIDNAVMYVLHAPCDRCALLIAMSGIVEVIYRDAYRTELGLLKLRSYGVKVRKVETGVIDHPRRRKSD